MSKKRKPAGTVSIETITPALAEKVLAANTANRPIRQSHTDSLARAQREGRWRLTNDAIVVTGPSLDDAGLVLNGQHRLWACFESGVPMECLVLCNAEPDSYTVLDSGIKRQARDAIHEKNAAVKAAVARMVLEYERGSVTAKSKGSGGNASNDEVVRTYRERPVIEKVVDEHIMGLKKILRSPVGVLAAASVLVSVDEKGARAFINSLVEGEGLKAGPILALRNRLIADTAKGRVSAPATMVLTLKAWNANKAGAGYVRAQLRDDDRAPPVVGYAHNPGTR